MADRDFSIAATLEVFGFTSGVDKIGTSLEGLAGAAADFESKIGAVFLATQAAATKTAEAIGGIASSGVSNKDSGLDKLGFSLDAASTSAETLSENTQGLQSDFDALNDSSRANTEAIAALEEGQREAGKTVVATSATMKSQGSVADVLRDKFRQLGNGTLIVKRLFSGLFSGILISPIFAVINALSQWIVKVTGLGEALGLTKSRTEEAAEAIRDLTRDLNAAETSRGAAFVTGATPRDKDPTDAQDRVTRLQAALDLTIKLNAEAKAAGKTLGIETASFQAFVGSAGIDAFAIEVPKVTSYWEDLYDTVKANVFPSEPIPVRKLVEGGDAIAAIIEQLKIEVAETKREEAALKASASQRDATVKNVAAEAAARERALDSAAAMIDSLERERDALGDVNDARDAENQRREAAFRQDIAPLNDAERAAALDLFKQRADEAELARRRRITEGELEFVDALQREAELSTLTSNQREVEETILQRRIGLQAQGLELSKAEEAVIRQTITERQAAAGTEAELEFVAALQEETRLAGLTAEQREIDTTILERKLILQQQGLELSTAEEAAIRSTITARQTADAGFGEGLDRGIDASIAKLTNLQALGERVGATVVGFSEGLATSLLNVFTGAKSGFRDFAASFLRQIAVMILQALILRAILAVVSFGASETAGNAALAANAGLLANSAGGFTEATLDKKALGGSIHGAGGIDNVLIRATAGEYMHTVAAVQHYGVGVMSALNRRLIPRGALTPFVTGGDTTPLNRSHFESGGFVSGQGGVRQAAPAQQVFPVLVADDANMNRLLSGGVNGFRSFIRYHATDLRGDLGV